MAENSLPDKLNDSLEEELSVSLQENFTLSNFNTAAVFGDSPAQYIPDQNLPRALPPSELCSPQTSYSEKQKKIETIGTPNVQPAAYKYCSNCDTRNPPENAFCDQCGTPFTLINPFRPDVIKENLILSAREYADRTEPLPPVSQSGNYEQKTYAEPINFATGSILESHYQVISHLGQGGFGDIYAIKNIESYFSETQVLKLVHTRYAETFPIQSPEALRDSYRSQYKAWKYLSEKEPDHVVRLFDVKVIEQRVGLLMEFMEGGTLLDLVESWGGKPQTQEQMQHLIKAFIQASRALHNIHKYNLIHCDVKPHNFLLDATKQKCKLCDFELLAKTVAETDLFSEGEFGSDKSVITGTLNFMSPEALQGVFSQKSDIYALGVSFYLLLSGEYPVDPTMYLESRHSVESKPKSLTELNSLVSPALDRLIQWCLEPDPSQRPDSVADLLHRLLQLGISDEESNFSPVNLARLLLNHLSPIDLDWLIDHLQLHGYRSMSELPEFQRQDMVEEYCYTTSPFEILKEHCGGASLYAIADALEIKKEKLNREDLIKEIVTSLGFLPGRKQGHGLESIRRALENSRIKIESAETIAECRGHLDHAFAEIERAVNLLIIFYGQTLYGKGLNNFLSKNAKNKPIEKMTFGDKVGTLRQICTQKPNAPLPERVERVFNFPLVSAEVFAKLDYIVTRRNHIFHNRTGFSALHSIQTAGQEILRSIVEIVKDFASNRYAPRVVQITSLQNDVFGRHFYEGYDEKGKKEKIFTTFGLQVGQLYWFVPLTNPARINPLIFPFEEPE